MTIGRLIKIVFDFEFKPKITFYGGCVQLANGEIKHAYDRNLKY